MNILYESEVEAQGGVHGHIKSKGGAIDIDVFAPSGVRDNEHEKTNPEELFAAAYASCLDATLHHIAEAKDIQLKEATIQAKVKAVQVEKGDLRFALDISVKLPDVSGDEAQLLLDEAYANCPISKATDKNMDVDIKLA